MINLLYVSFNRRAFTEATFTALLQNTNWDLVSTVHVHDDGSKDGTDRYLLEAMAQVPDGVQQRFESMRLGGPVAATNRHLNILPETPEVQRFVKIDSDMVVSPGWLDELVRVSNLNPGVDLLGIQPRFGPPVAGEYDGRGIEDARHIGGIGLMRHRAFEVCRPTANGRMGFTEWQCRHPESRKAWITPDLPCFCLDLIDLEPWASLSLEYEAKQWQRPWSKYIDGGRSYYEWWAQ